VSAFSTDDETCELMSGRSESYGSEGVSALRDHAVQHGTRQPLRAASDVIDTHERRGRVHQRAAARWHTATGRPTLMLWTRLTEVGAAWLWAAGSAQEAVA
jgi:hypothetical protein